MRRPALLTMLALCVALAAGLAWLWLTPQGQLKGVVWTPPAPIKPALDSGAALPATGVDLGQMVTALDRPLFAPTRRPPPPPQAASAPVVDPFPDMRLLATYGNGSVGGAVALVDGRIVRAKLGDAISGWVLKTLSPKGAELVQGGDTRFVELSRVVGNELAAQAAAAGRGAAPPGSYEAVRQREREEARIQVRRMNALRANMGLAPLPEP